MNRSKKFPRPYRRSSATPHVPTAVSVIIPMYNAERYIADGLDSLLAQTFQNFEVIVVDDCSTDKSCAVVESYRERFGGRLTLAHMATNTGSGALPRNKGIMLSRGEYVYFVDNDDLLTPTAFEELYTLAKKFDADVVYCEKHFETDEDGTGRKIIPDGGTLVDKPTWESRDLSQAVQKIVRDEYRVEPWRKFTRRDFLIEHEIFFPSLKIHEDTIWTYGLIFFAKKFLLVPNTVYIWIQRKNSLYHRQRTPSQSINFWLTSVQFGLRYLDDLMGRHEFFKANPQYRYAVTEKFVSWTFGNLFGAILNVPPSAIYDIIKRELGNGLGEYDVLIPALATAINTQMKINLTNHRQYQQFAAQAQARIAELEAQVKRLQS
ncbi:MAG: glycosyltransferase [Quinella sp. 2Q5]|nr:glycosyltransferase [Quinella sp. 2Q5]